jgi:hypothetical protein
MVRFETTHIAAVCYACSQTVLRRRANMYRMRHMWKSAVAEEIACVAVLVLTDQLRCDVQQYQKQSTCTSRALQKQQRAKVEERRKNDDLDVVNGGSARNRCHADSCNRITKLGTQPTAARAE